MSNLTNNTEALQNVLTTLQNKAIPNTAEQINIHNTDTSAHADIREQISQLSSEKVDKNALTLGLHSDNKYYIFVNGTPVGTGMEFSKGDVFGYVDENNNIVLNGNLADGNYTVKYEMENGNTINIGNIVLDTNVYYSVTKNLTQCSISNSATQIVEGESYSATISANSGYELKSVTVTMGGTDITSSAVSGGIINIASVTGNIVITAVAEEAQMRTNFAEPNSADWLVNSRVRSNGTISTPVGGADAQRTFASNYIDVQNGDIILIQNASLALYNHGFYDGNKTKLQCPNFVDAQNSSYMTDVIDTGTEVQFKINVANTEFMRFSLTQVDDKNAVVINIKRNDTWL